MYNRYIPQPDGSFRRSRVPEKMSDGTYASNIAEVTDQPVMQPDSSLLSPVPVSNQLHSQTVTQELHRSARPTSRVTRPQPQRETNGTSINGFLNNILPPNFDTEDLLVVFLLLLMSSRNEDNQNNALLTLAVYLFL